MIFPATKLNGDKPSINGLFGLYEFKPLDTLTLTAGVRRDDHESFGAEPTGRLAIAYNPADQVTLSASWGEGYKAPTIFQTTFFCCGATEPNSDLKPETSKASDVGVVIKPSDSRGKVGLTYFDQETVNLITFSFGIGGYENIAEATSKGVELDASYRLAEWLDASIAYAYIDAKDGDGAALIRVPRQSGNVQLTFNPEGRLNGTMLVTYNGEEQDPNGAVDSWTRVDLSGRFALTETVELYGRIENLFDEQYQQIIGYGTPGLSGHLGAQLRF